MPDRSILLDNKGYVTVAEYMRQCLRSYYEREQVFGGDGDFITAPEISQMFGEIIGAWCIQQWIELGEPERFLLLELGPGRGLLMRDILRSARVKPEFLNSMKLAMYEQSKRLQAWQIKAVEPMSVIHVEDLEALPEMPLIVVANEFFDALPVHQLIKRGGELFENCVTEDGEGLRFTQAKTKFSELYIAEDFAGDGVFEICPEVDKIIGTLSSHLCRFNGSMIIVDYGYYMRPKPSGDTLQALSEHSSVSVLERPGECDLTCHVDFANLEDVIQVHCPKATTDVSTQGDFLLQCGIGYRANKLMQSASPEQRKVIATALERLTGKQQMGELFKVLTCKVS